MLISRLWLNFKKYKIGEYDYDFGEIDASFKALALVICILTTPLAIVLDLLLIPLEIIYFAALKHYKKNEVKDE